MGVLVPVVMVAAGSLMVVIAVPVLAHRLLLKRSRQANAKDAAIAFLEEVLSRIAVPA